MFWKKRWRLVPDDIDTWRLEWRYWFTPWLYKRHVCDDNYALTIIEQQERRSLHFNRKDFKFE